MRFPPRLMRASYPIVLVCGALALGQEPLVASRRGGESAPPASVKFTPSVVGSLNCSSCHADPENYPNEALTCRMVEYPVWKTRDRHQIAYDVLLSPRAEEMGLRLGITVT